MKKRISLLLVLALALSLMACAPETADPTTAPETTVPTTAPVETTGETAAQAEGYPMTLTDQAGRTVTLEGQPEKIVSGYYISTSALIGLGLEEKIVGLEAKADSRPIYSLSAPELLDKPNVGTAKQFDLEGCAALEPDLVILPQKLADAAQTLEELGIPALLVNPESQDLAEEMVSLLAQATGTEERGAEILAFLDEQEQSLTALLAGAEQPTVYLAGNSSFLSTAGEAMYQSSLITLAGGQNAAAEITDAYWAEVSYEQVLAWDPEYIILASDAEYTVEDVLSDKNLSGCAAVAEGNVYQMPGDAEAWDSPVPSGILGAVWLASVLHPEQVTEDAWLEAANGYYETFYDFTYGENQ